MGEERRLEYMPLEELNSAERNPKKHSGQIPTSIGRFGYTEPIVLDERTGRMVAGHGRREALMQMRAGKEAPPEGIQVDEAGRWLVPVLRGWASRSDTEAQAYLLASNRLTEAGGWDEDALESMLRELAASQALDGLGWDEKELKKLLAESGDAQEYTSKIEAPIYKPTGPKPSVGELCSTQKRDELTREVEAAEGVSDEEKAFLLLAAQRHLVFDYQAVAEYYAHASAPTQRLMERSALVIIDFNQAIESGFVRLTEDLAEAYAAEGDE